MNNSSIQTIGPIYMPQFFSEFIKYGVNGASFFENIYPIYADKTLEIYNYNVNNPTAYPLTDALYRINGLSNSGLINGFQTLKALLGPDALNLNFNNYVNFIITLQSKVLYTDVLIVWKDFKQYYTTVAYPSPDSPPQQNVTVWTLIEWIEDINKTSNKGPYFSKTNSDFNIFLQKLIQTSYSTSSLKSDIKIGQTYDNFMNMGSITTTPSSTTGTIQGFSNMPTMYNGNDDAKDIDIFQSFINWIQSLFGMTENMEDSPSQSDYATLQRFNIKDFNVELREVKKKLRRYGVKNIDSGKSEWRNIINVIDKLTKLNMTIQNLDAFIKLMENFGAKNINEWYNVLERLTELKIKSFNNIKIFIELITDFNVSYSKNFVDFIETIVIFKPDLSSSLDTIIGFIGDMTTVGFKYDTNSKDVRNIVRYFTACKFTLDTYKHMGETPITGFVCNNTSSSIDNTIIGLPSKLVLSFYSYNTANGIQNGLVDIKMPELVLNTPYCNVIDAMQQAYMISKNASTYNNVNTLIVPYISNIAAFFYKEELDNILTNIDAYSSENKRVSIMTGISEGMLKYAETFVNNSVQRDKYDVYISLANIIRLFPAVMFQYMSNEFISKCSSDNNCLYHTTVDPVYAECKANANANNSTKNYRPNAPVI